MADYGPLTPSNRLEWFLMNGGSGGSGGGEGGEGGSDVEAKTVSLYIQNTTEGNVAIVLPVADDDATPCWRIIPSGRFSSEMSVYVVGGYVPIAVISQPAIVIVDDDSENRGEVTMSLTDNDVHVGLWYVPAETFESDDGAVIAAGGIG